MCSFVAWLVRQIKHEIGGKVPKPCLYMWLCVEQEVVIAVPLLLIMTSC